MAKIIAHEWHRTRGLLALIFGIAIGLTVMSAGMLKLNLAGISALGFITGLIAVGAFLPAVQIALGVDYWFANYRRTGYFTQTLPIKGSTQYWAKLFYGIVVCLVALVLNAGTLLLWLWASQKITGLNLRALKEAWAQLHPMLSWEVWFIGIFILAMFACGMLIQLYFVASVGSEEPLNRLGFGGPVVVYVIYYFSYQALTLISIFLIPWGINNRADGTIGLVRESFFTGFPNVSAEAMPIGFVPVILITYIFLIWRTVYSWNRKVSLA